MNITISSFFSVNGAPATGLTPTIRVWEVTPTSHTLVVGQPVTVADPTMTEVGDGFYKFTLDSILHGYNSAKDYVMRADGGSSLPVGERYQVANTAKVAVDENNIAEIVSGVWDVDVTAHINTDSAGLFLNQINTNSHEVRIDVLTAISLVETLIKYEANRTKIDKTARTLTIYDNDGITPLKVFDLKDGAGSPSITEVCERVPV